jgi:REP element-mobilizing transposase RayT
MQYQLLFDSQIFRRSDTHGGSLRRRRRGRGARPINSKNPIHLVLRRHRSRNGSFRNPREFYLILAAIRQYSRRFAVKIEMQAIQGNHIHFLIRVGNRTQFQSFVRVLAGQIAQRVTDTFRERKTQDFWEHRPWTRIVKGWKAYQIVQAYIHLNEQEAIGNIPYQEKRLAGLAPRDREIIWGFG